MVSVFLGTRVGRVVFAGHPLSFRLSLGSDKPAKQTLQFMDLNIIWKKRTKSCMRRTKIK